MGDNVSSVCAAPGCEHDPPHIHLYKFLFRLPGALGVEDGTQVLQLYDSSTEEGGAGTFAQVTIRQVEIESDDDPTYLSILAMSAIDKSTESASGAGSTPPRMRRRHTVVAVITPANSPDLAPKEWDGHVESLGPREDAFMRALHAARTVSRSVRLEDQGIAPLLPTYERLPAMILMWDAVIEDHVDPRALDDIEWQKTSALFLEHRNLPGTEPASVPGDALDFWAQLVGMGMPAVLARERFIEAKRLAYQEGEYGAAVISAATGVEVFCDALLSALLWEECIQDKDKDWTRAMADAVGIYSDRTPLQRATTHTTPRLGGDWTSSPSPWQVYRGRAASLRNRIVHAGYEPRRQEALEAIEQAVQAQQFLLSRLVDNAKKYPRCAIMFVGKEELRHRGAYVGAFRRFIDEIAPTEPPYAVNYSGWHRSLIDKASAH